MSKINLTPNASGTGTLTVTSPNTNSDYTLTLPAVTGTFNTSGAVNEVPAGSNTAPSIYFTGDTNTGIYSPGADSIALTEGGVEGLRLNSSGNVQLAGNLGLGGTTPTTSGTGITFPATQSASTDANTLDDYEEGTWTPALSASTSAPTVSYSYRPGYYTKIGNRVFVNGTIAISSISGGSGNSLISGLPFASKNVSRNYSAGSVIIRGVDLPAGTNCVNSAMDENVSQFYFLVTIDDAVNQQISIGSWSSSDELIFELSYLTD